MGWEWKVALEKGCLSDKQGRNVLSEHPQNSEDRIETPQLDQQGFRAPAHEKR